MSQPKKRREASPANSIHPVKLARTDEFEQYLKQQQLLDVPTPSLRLESNHNQAEKPTLTDEFEQYAQQKLQEASPPVTSVESNQREKPTLTDEFEQCAAQQQLQEVSPPMSMVEPDHINEELNLCPQELEFFFIDAFEDAFRHPGKLFNYWPEPDIQNGQLIH